MRRGGELESDDTAERAAHQVRGRDIQGLDQRSEIAHVVSRGARYTLALTVAAPVVPDDGEILCESTQDPVPPVTVAPLTVHEHEGRSGPFDVIRKLHAVDPNECHA